MACEVLWAIVMGRSLASSAIGSVIRAIAIARSYYPRVGPIG
jgi:hypothetical protein